MKSDLHPMGAVAVGEAEDGAVSPGLDRLEWKQGTGEGQGTALIKVVIIKVKNTNVIFELPFLRVRFSLFIFLLL